MSDEATSAELIGTQEKHEIVLSYRVSGWPDRVDPWTKEKWIFRPDLARVRLERQSQTDPWRVDTVSAHGSRVLLGDRTGKQSGSRSYDPARAEIPPEVAELAARALDHVQTPNAKG
jgi:hypothetical protein